MLWQTLGTPENNDKAVVIIAKNIPYFGALAAFYVPVLGAILLLISSNSGVFGASRIAYSMSQARLLPSLFRKVHRRYNTPVVSIVTFSSLSVFVLFLAALQGDDGFDFLADLYAFGAALSYTLVFAALIALRFKEPDVPRPFRIPVNVRIKRGGPRRALSGDRRPRVLRHLHDPRLRDLDASAGSHRRSELGRLGLIAYAVYRKPQGTAALRFVEARLVRRAAHDPDQGRRTRTAGRTRRTTAKRRKKRSFAKRGSCRASRPPLRGVRRAAACRIGRARR